MKTIFKSILCCCAFALCTAPMTGCSDSDDEPSAGAGFRDVNNPVEGSEVSRYGETITVSFTTDAGWDLETPTVDWVEIKNKANAEEGGKSSIRLAFDENTSDATRSVDLYITVKGHARSLLCSMTQASASGAKIDEYLNGKMDERLKKEYLWNTAYNALADKGQINYKTSFDNFLYENLTKLGETNIEDGGYYRDYTSTSIRGKRYIYSNIQEIGGARASAASAPVTRASTSTGLGMGPTLAMVYNSQKQENCLSLGYVYLESPAAKAGLRRGDMIVSVNGTRLNSSNYYKYQVELYTSTSGTYKLTYARYKDDGVTLVEYETTVTAGSYKYNPVIFPGLLQSDTQDINIGYLVLESFDLASQEIIEGQLQEYASRGIKDLILDLRFNPGGSVAQCRYLMSSIVGKAHYDDTFAKMTFVDGTHETWSFGYGNPSQSDGLGQGPDLGLSRLYVICSENTASASEIVINSLKGIDFPVTTYGSRTEGKNVGMVTSQLVYDGRRFEYAPITFYVKNAKDFGDYADGFKADKEVNNQNSDWNDDIDSIFPYGPTEWGNLKGADPALTWAVQNITQGTDPDFNEKVSAAAYGKTRSGAPGMEILQNAPVKLKMGRFGNVIYGTTVEEK